MSTFDGCTSFVLLRFVFSFVWACLHIISGLRLVLCVFCCIIIFCFAWLPMTLCWCCVLPNVCRCRILLIARVCCGCCRVFAFARCNAWPMPAWVNVLCGFCLLFHFFGRNESRHDVPGNFSATRSPKSCMSTPPYAELTPFPLYCEPTYPHACIHTHI